MNNELGSLSRAIDSLQSMPEGLQKENLTRALQNALRMYSDKLSVEIQLEHELFKLKLSGLKLRQDRISELKEKIGIKNNLVKEYELCTTQLLTMKN